MSVGRKPGPPGKQGGAYGKAARARMDYVGTQHDSRNL